MGHPTSDKPKRKRNIEFAPPEPETNICPLCNDTIPEDTLRSPKILCGNCHRPIACPSCKEEILKPVGITTCPWCRDDPESTDKIKQAVFIQQEKEEAERLIVETGFKPELMSKGMFASVSSTSMMTGYPYRDGPDVMMTTEGWGVPPTKYKKPKIDHVKPPEHNSKVPSDIIKEEAQRGTGRSTQRCLSAMNHLFHRASGKPYMDREVLFVVDNQRLYKHTKRNLENLYIEKFNMGSGVFQTVMKSIQIKTTDQIYSFRSSTRYTLVVVDLIAALPAKRARDLRRHLSIYGVPIIGGESIIEYEEPEPEEPAPKLMDVPAIKASDPKIILKDGTKIPITKAEITINENYDPIYAIGMREAIGHTVKASETLVTGTIENVDVIQNAGDIIGVALEGGEPEQAIKVQVTNGNIISVHTQGPLQAGDLVQAATPKSRKELPPASATRCMKCGNSGDHCTCNEEPKMSWWKRVIKEMTDYYPLKFYHGMPHRRPKKCPTCGGDEPSSVPHLCPYDEDINGITDKFCWCCHSCEGNCAYDT